MKKFGNALIIYPLIGALLLWAGWPVSNLTFLLFIAWVPLLLLVDKVKNGKQFFFYTWLQLLLWNLLTTWWIWYASPPGAAGAILANSLLMTVPWLLFYQTKKRIKSSVVSYLSLIVYWLTFEYLHHNWELSWPWLTLGNAFAMQPQWVQWYQYTGTAGGSLWILLANILLVQVWNTYTIGGRSKKYAVASIAAIIVLLLPIMISRQLLKKEKMLAENDLQNAKHNVVVVQPNVDPYHEKFMAGSADRQIQKLIFLSEQKMDRNTALVVWPETAVAVQVNENAISENYFYNPIWGFLNRHPFSTLVTGIDSYKDYGADATKSSTARLDKAGGVYYDLFNTAVQLEADTTIQLYHKSKLVPGIETLPSFLKFMGRWFEGFGGISGTLGVDTARSVFVPWNKYYKSAPIICYESIYGDFITEYVRKGANILTIITNDGWWRDTPGYKQHQAYARLRAIETRKWVARSANTGISCFINPLGNVLQPQPWETEAVIKQEIPVNDRLTFYVKYGDWLSRISSALSVAVLLLTLVAWMRRKK